MCADGQILNTVSPRHSIEYFCVSKSEKQKRKCYEKILIVALPYSVCRRGIFNCTSYPCPAVCTIYGDRHYYTFDGLEYDYVSDCQAYLLKVGRLFIYFHMSNWKFPWEGKYLGHQKMIQRNIHQENRCKTDVSKGRFHKWHFVLIHLKMVDGCVAMWSREEQKSKFSIPP